MCNAPLEGVEGAVGGLLAGDEHGAEGGAHAGRAIQLGHLHAADDHAGHHLARVPHLRACNADWQRVSIDVNSGYNLTRLFFVTAQQLTSQDDTGSSVPSGASAKSLPITLFSSAHSEKRAYA